MVSWGDGEESSQDLSDASSNDVNTMYDSDYCGSADGPSPPRCKHGAVAAKFVSFERCYTGRRFLGCAGEDGDSCDFFKWVDEDWSSSAEKALGKLWDMYAQMKSGRVNDALDNVEQKFKYQDEITKLERDLKTSQAEVKKVVEEKHLTLALKAKAEQALIEARAELEQKKILDASTTNMHKALRIKAEKDRDKLKEEKKKMEFIIADFLKQKEVTRAKIRKIKEICDE